MEKITLPKSSEEEIDKNHSRFVIEPLYPGYGPTLGNALRRVLLSSLPGAAITSFKVEGINHEFTAIPHVKEDAVEIMLNLQNVKVQSYSDEPQILTLSKKGPDEVKASDFSKNSEVEILNPEAHIATLDNKAKFEIEVVVERGRGFRSTELVEREKSIGTILVDASFSPIERVKLDVENTRVGQMTNYDKLVLEVKTNGSIEPKQAMIDASNILIDHYSAFSFDQKPEEKQTEEPEADEKIEELDSQESTDDDVDPKTKVEDLDLSSRTQNALLNAGIKTVAGLQRLSDLKLSEIKGLGKKGIAEIKEQLNED